MTAVAAPSTGGTVTPGTSQVQANTEKVFTITPAPGYAVSSVVIGLNGSTLEYPTEALSSILTAKADGGYTMTWKVSGPMTIMVAFEQAVVAPLFPDVKESDWFYNQVQYAGSHGLMKGYEDGAFRPEAQMTIAEYLTIMYRYAREQAPSVITEKATTGANWLEAANWINSMLLNSKYTNIDTTAMSRYDMADITYVVLRVVDTYTTGDFKTRSTHGFTDVPAGSSYYEILNYLESIYAIDGNPMGNGTYTFLGGNNIKRSEVATVLYNFMTKQ